MSETLPQSSSARDTLMYVLIGGENIAVLQETTVNMLILGERFAGQGPVNRYFGNFTYGEIGKVGSTMMAGPDSLLTYETQFFQALESSTVKGVGEDTLFVQKEGKNLLLFERK
jgi:heat shock protein HslJ